MGGQLIETTKEHPFYVENKGWTKALDLLEGDLLISADGDTIAVESVQITSEVKPVYNLRVSEDHTYFVGRENWGFSVWVHNTYSVREIPPNLINGKTGYYGLWDDTIGSSGGFARSTKNGKIIRGAGQQTMEWISQNANKIARLPASPTFNPLKQRHYFSTKIKNIRQRYPDIRKFKNGGGDEAKALAENAYKNLKPRVGKAINETDKYNIYFDDGAISWIFSPDGVFRSVFNNARR